jgi:hypothetical protein
MLGSAKVSAAYGKAQRLAMKVQGTIMHGFFKLACLVGASVPRGADLTCTVLMVALALVATSGVGLPRHLHWQMDGGSENWNKVVFGFCAYLVSIDVFETIELCRLPMGHTHEDIDAMFGCFSRFFRGKWKKGTRTGGHDALHPLAFGEGVLKATNNETEAGKQALTVWVHSLFGFTKWLEKHTCPALRGYGPSQDWMMVTDTGGQSRHILSRKTSHTRFIRFHKERPGDELAVASFARDVLAAQQGEFYCEGVTVLKSLPTGAPTLTHFPVTSWKEEGETGASSWEACLQGVRSASTTLPDVFKPEVVRRWEEFGEQSPCGVSSTVGDFTATLNKLRRVPLGPVQPPPAVVPTTTTLLASPILHSGYSAAERGRAIDAAVLGEAVEDWALDWSQLRLGDWAFAVTRRSSDAALDASLFTFTDSTSRVGRPCELLRIVSLHPKPNANRKVEWAYYKLVDRTDGVLTFEPTGRVAKQPWQQNEMLVVWDQEHGDPDYTAGRYTVPNQQAAQALRVLQSAPWLQGVPDAVDEPPAAGQASKSKARAPRSSVPPSAPVANRSQAAAAVPAGGATRPASKRKTSGGEGAAGAEGRGGKRNQQQRWS